MTSNSAAASHRSAKLVYPELPKRLGRADLHRLFSPSYRERQWAPTVARKPASQAALLVQLKVFQSIGRFLGTGDIPAIIVEHVAGQLGISSELYRSQSERTVYRHRPAVLKFLGVTSWGSSARQLAESTMMKLASARTDPADLINAAVDILVQSKFELPALIALRRIAGTAHRRVNAGQWRTVCEHLDGQARARLEALLIVDPKIQQSPFAELCRPAGRATRKNLNALIARHEWLLRLPDPTAALRIVADSKVLLWANEAMRLNALELREYVTPRRLTLLLAVLRHARGKLLDELTRMLLKLVRKVEAKSEERLTDWYQARHAQTDTLIRAFHDVLLIAGTDQVADLKVAQIDASLAAHGGRDSLRVACGEHLRHEKQNWRPFARHAFAPLRAPLLKLAELLPLQATEASLDLMGFISAVSNEFRPYSDYYDIANVSPELLPRDWRPLVLDDPNHPDSFNRRQLEVAALLELAAAIKAGDIFVNGSLSYDRFWDRLPPDTADPSCRISSVGDHPVSSVEDHLIS